MIRVNDKVLFRGKKAEVRKVYSNDKYDIKLIDNPVLYEKINKIELTLIK